MPGPWAAPQVISLVLEAFLFYWGSIGVILGFYWGSIGSRCALYYGTPIMENQMEKKMENEMETPFRVLGFRV